MSRSSMASELDTPFVPIYLCLLQNGLLGASRTRAHKGVSAGPDARLSTNQAPNSFAIQLLLTVYHQKIERQEFATTKRGGP